MEFAPPGGDGGGRGLRPAAGLENIDIRSNLILQVRSAAPNLQQVAGRWFVNNWWDDSAEPAAVAGIARRLDRIPVITTDLARPDFLKPVFAELPEDLRDAADFPGRYAPAELSSTGSPPGRAVPTDN